MGVLAALVGYGMAMVAIAVQCLDGVCAVLVHVSVSHLTSTQPLVPVPSAMTM